VGLAVIEAGGNTLIMAGTGSNSTEHTVENTRMAKQLGADIALWLPPIIISHPEGIFPI